MDIKEYLQICDKVIAGGPFKDNWESLSGIETPKWFSQGNFGIFIHWGCYSVPACQNEWYPRLMYQPGQESYEHRIRTYGKDCDYSRIVRMFHPDKFDADEWLSILGGSGAKYIMPVGEHHDGVKMYRSSLNRWNMYDLTGRDFLAELHAAADRAGMGFLTSSHRAEHYFFLNTARKYFPQGEVSDPAMRDLYGPAALPADGDENAFNDHDSGFAADTPWLQDWLASSCEIVDVNRPLALYFDWWIHMPVFRPYVKKFLAYYYNRGREWGIEPAVFCKLDSCMQGCAIFDVERGQVGGVMPWKWQCDTAIAKNSWGYTEGNDFKTVYEVLVNLVDVASKNGCLMLDVGPKADGTICDEEKAVLAGVGRWMHDNGEAIYGAEPFRIWGEHSSKQTDVCGDSVEFVPGDYRFTYKTGVVYAFAMDNGIRGEYKILGLRRGEVNAVHFIIKKISLCGHDQPLPFVQNDEALTITLPAQAAAECATGSPICFKIEID